MKHSAKLFTALAALALFAVVMVGIQDRSADAQSGGTTGQVYLTNLNSCLTTQAAPPSSLDCGNAGRVFRRFRHDPLHHGGRKGQRSSARRPMNNDRRRFGRIEGHGGIDSDMRTSLNQASATEEQVNTAAGEFTVVSAPDRHDDP